MIKDLRRVYERLEKEVRQNKQDITYKLLISIKDWDEYFANIKVELLSELERLERN
jgi:hypothetical protein